MILPSVPFACSRTGSTNDRIRSASGRRSCKVYSLARVKECLAVCGASRPN